jgi:SWIM zinc finger
MTTWTSAQVLALAPDDSSIKSGKSLASHSKWQNIGASTQAIWGECQGSGKNPYQASIDLQEPAFKCSCPSRKFPCKHGLGLFLIYADKPELFPPATSPAWVTEWLFKREQSATKKTEKQQAPIDPAAQAQRQEKREQKITAGLVELDRWLQDLMGQGLADMPSKSYDFWDGMAARMVDAQAPGLARRLKEAAGIANSGDPNWVATLLTELSKIHLLVRGYGRLNELPSGLRSEVRTQIGWTMPQEELMDLANKGEAETISGDWLVLGQTVTEEESGLRAQRIWLRGQERFGLILNFVYRQAPLDLSWRSGSIVAAKLVFYPSSAPLRAVALERSASSGQSVRSDANISQALVGVSLSESLYRHHQATIANPWLEMFPCLCQEVIPYRQNENWWIIDREGIAIPLNIPERNGWQLAALSGGSPVVLSGLWNHRHLLPLGVWANDHYCAIGGS